MMNFRPKIWQKSASQEIMCPHQLTIRALKLPIDGVFQSKLSPHKAFRGDITVPRYRNELLLS